jgi:asparagine synthase (glutamine-hydrolysing)
LSGLAAIYDRGGTQPTGEELEVLLRAIGHRGVSSQRWFGEGIALGVRLLATTPEAMDERLPLDVLGGRYQIAFDGRLDNRDELTGLQDVAAGRTLTDAELVVLAYEAWGSDCVRRLVGDFAFVLWDTQTRRLFAARDQRGFRPLFYVQQRGRISFGSEPGQLLQIAGVVRQIDQLFLACHLTGAATQRGSTPYQAIREVPAAHYFEIEADGAMRLREYWQYAPRQQFTYRRREEYVEHFDQVFSQAIRSAARANEAPGVLLSGGLDSSYVAAKAAEVAPDLISVTAYTPGTKRMDERQYSRAVVERLGIRSVEFDATECWSLSSRYLDTEKFDDPTHPMQGPAVMKSCEKAAEAGITVLLDGVGGDEFFTGDADYLAQLASRGHLIHAAAEARAWARASGVSLRKLLKLCVASPMLPSGARSAWRGARGLGVPSPTPAWLRRDAMESLGLAEALALPSSLSVWARGPRHSILWSLYMAELVPIISWWQRHAALPNGIESRSPMWDLRVIEFMLRTPQWVHRSGGQPKMLLRGAMEGRVPAEVIARQDKGVFDELMNEGLIRQENARARDAIVHGLADLDYIDTAALERELVNYCARPHPWWDGLWRAITGGLWLQYEQEAAGKGVQREAVLV